MVNANITLFTDNGVQPNTTYYYQVCAKNRAGQTCATSAMTTTPQRPPTPPEYSLQALSSTEIKVDYRNTAGALANVLELQYSTDGNFGSVLGGQNVPVAGSTVTIGSLQANTRYYFRLRASNTTAQLASDWVLKDVAT